MHTTAKIAQGIVDMLYHAGYTELVQIEDDSSIGLSMYVGGRSPNDIDISITIAYTE